MSDQEARQLIHDLNALIEGPSNDTWQKYGKLQEMIEKGRKRARARRKEESEAA